jgi:hypothetical protein
MRTVALAFVLTLAACERENTPPPAVGHNPPETIETSNPPAPSTASEWGGAWSTDFGTINFQQQGNQVTGSYSYTNAGAQVDGTIHGTITGNRLDFEWQEGPGGAGSGHGSFLMKADGATFEGTWGQADSTTSGGAWNGKRM